MIQYSETPAMESRRCGTIASMSRPTQSDFRLFEHDPRRRMVAGAFLGPHFAIDAGLDQPRRTARAQQQVIEPQSGVARPAASFVIPERVHRLHRMKREDRIAPASTHPR